MIARMPLLPLLAGWAMWMGGLGSSHAACQCDASPQLRQCEATVTAAASIPAVDTLLTSNHLLTDTTDAKIAYQRLRRVIGDSATTSSLGIPLATIGSKQFAAPAFRSKLEHVMRQRIGFNLLHASPDMTLPGTDAGDLVFPGGAPVRISSDAKGPCWQNLSNPLLGAIGGKQLAAAFGHDFLEVGRIVEGFSKGSDDIDLSGACGFVMLSPHWAITALHCVAEQTSPGAGWKLKAFKNSSAGSWGGHRALFLGQPGELKKFPSGCFGLNGKTDCPWELLEVAEIKYKSLESEQAPNANKMPKHDIALVRLATSPKQSVRYPVFAPPNITNGETVTLVAYGTVEAPYEAFFRLQVGWNFAGSTSNDGRIFAWNPSKSSNQSSICPGDSGGAIFSGYENGGCSCANGGKAMPPRKLKGLVSFVDLPNNLQAVPSLLRACTASTNAGAIVPAHYKSWICSIAPGIAACKP